MTKNTIFKQFSIIAAMLTVSTMSTTSLTHAQSIDWRSDIVISKTSKSQNRAKRGNFNFPGLYKSQRNTQSFANANCRARSIRDLRTGSVPFTENECERQPFIVIQNDIFKGDGLDIQTR